LRHIPISIPPRRRSRPCRTPTDHHQATPVIYRVNAVYGGKLALPIQKPGPKQARLLLRTTTIKATAVRCAVNYTFRNAGHGSKNFSTEIFAPVCWQALPIQMSS
jgi:hypothetical protein